ncbi:hypothetical protein B0H13DRAFT_1902733 [Mycena leptocephala]|nr:hypothetical protein B0H13DRAFT_1902733 [Mycena leptocephala]
MTHTSNLAPAASTVAGAGVASNLSPNASLAALNKAVDKLVEAALAVAGTPATDLALALGAVTDRAAGISAACTAVSASVAAALANGSTHPAPPSSVPAPPPGGGFLRTEGPWIAALYSVLPGGSLTPIPDNNDKWFAITRGKYVGLTTNAAISLNAVTGISTGLSEKFSSQADALNTFNAALATGAVAIIA